jgi:hypothetical protein
MSKRILALGIIAASTSLVACSAGNEDGPAASSSFTYADGSPLPVTAWGDPDLQGTWPIMHLLSTQLQRNPNLGERLFLTDEEYEAALNGRGSQASRDAAYHQMVASNSLGMGGWAESTIRSPQARQTSLISYPLDGRFPALTARGQELIPVFGRRWSTERSGEPFLRPQVVFDTWDRCITRGMPSSMLPFNFNNGIRIIQSPGYVVIDLEMVHESRIVPIDRESLDPAITQWMGASRGHWEGSTLVIETTNYNGEVGMTNAGIPGSPGMDTPSTTGMRTVERLTRVADNQIDYEMTIEDPAVLTDKWTISYPMYLDSAYQFFEYACHEDNTAVRNFIETSQYQLAHPEEFAQPAGGRGGPPGGGRGGPPGGGRGAPGAAPPPPRGAGAGQ